VRYHFCGVAIATALAAFPADAEMVHINTPTIRVNPSIHITTPTLGARGSGGGGAGRRETFDPYRSYRGVTQQQGRVTLTPDNSPSGPRETFNPYQSYRGVIQQQGRVTLTPDNKQRHRGR
jgi:hypothetical protein